MTAHRRWGGKATIEDFPRNPAARLGPICCGWALSWALLLGEAGLAAAQQPGAATRPEALSQEPTVRELRLSDCRDSLSESKPATLALDSGAELELALVVHAESLFVDRIGEPALPVFEPFADADRIYGNADGQVDLDELAASPFEMPSPVPAGKGEPPLSGGALSDAGGPLPIDAQGAGGTRTQSYGMLAADAQVSSEAAVPAGVVPDNWGDWLYTTLLPTVVRFNSDGLCSLSTARRHGGPF